MNSSVFFADENFGYNKNQVDEYIQKLAAEYQELHAEYAKILNRYSSRLTQPGASMEAIAKALVDAESMAIQITSEAKSEAARIIDDARSELEGIRAEKACLTLEINDILRRLQELVSLPATV